MNLTKEELKLLYKAVCYWRRYQAAYESKEDKMGLDLLNRFNEQLKS